MFTFDFCLLFSTLIILFIRVVSTFLTSFSLHPYFLPPYSIFEMHKKSTKHAYTSSRSSSCLMGETTKCGKSGGNTVQLNELLQSNWMLCSRKYCNIPSNCKRNDIRNGYFINHERYKLLWPSSLVFLSLSSSFGS